MCVICGKRINEKFESTYSVYKRLLPGTPEDDFSQDLFCSLCVVAFVFHFLYGNYFWKWTNGESSCRYCGYGCNGYFP